MKALSITITFILSCAFIVKADDKLNALWQKGNSFYAQKIYDSAAYYFEQIAALKPQKADVYYNLGNTYYRLNKIAPAVLNYERALKIKPNFKEAKENLLLTQTRINNHIQPIGDIFFIKWWNNITRPDKASVWSIVALIVFILIIGILLLIHFNNPLGKMAPVQVVLILGLFWVCFITFAITAVKKSMDNSAAVVLQNDTPLLNNDLKGKPLAQLPEGTTVSIISEKDMWIEVRVPDGRTGWLQLTLVEKI